MEGRVPEPEYELKRVVTLNRYLEWATHMAARYNEDVDGFSGKLDWDDPLFKRLFMHMCYWYATLYVVIEGWHDLKLSDPKVDSLLVSPHVQLLKRYRNGVFHFQAEYIDNRHIGFMEAGTEGKKWLHELHTAFHFYFRDWFERHNLDGSLK
jgi:hypothetical protein